MTEKQLWDEVGKLQKRIEKLEEWLDILKDNQQVQMDMIFKLQQQLNGTKEKDDGDRS